MEQRCGGPGQLWVGTGQAPNQAPLRKCACFFPNLNFILPHWQRRQRSASEYVSDIISTGWTFSAFGGNYKFSQLNVLIFRGSSPFERCSLRPSPDVRMDFLCCQSSDTEGSLHFHPHTSHFRPLWDLHGVTARYEMPRFDLWVSCVCVAAPERNVFIQREFIYSER